MTKTAPLDNDTHKLLKDIQTTLRNRYDIGMSIGDIIAHVVPNCDEAVRKIIKDIKLEEDHDASSKIT